MKLYYSLAFIIFLSWVYCLDITPNLTLTTTAPDSAPYFIGTEINTIKLGFDSNGQALTPTDKVILFVGNKKLELLKIGNEYISNPDIMITPDLVKDSKLRIEISPIQGYQLSKKTFEFEIEDITNYIELIKPEIKSLYNYGQEIVLEYTINPFKKDLKNLKMWVFKPAIEDNQFSCIDFVCKKSFVVPNLDANITPLIIYGSFVYHGRNIPFVDSYELNLVDNLSIELLNPTKEGYLYNPFAIEFKVKYANGEFFKGNIAKFVFDGKEKILKKKGDYYFVNTFLFPFLSFNHSLEFSSGKSKATLNTNFSLKPTLWFYLLVCFFVFVFLIELIIHIVKRFKKYDLNELIAKRDFYKEKQKKLRKDFLSQKITKTYFDAETEKLEYIISYLNKQILELEKKEEQSKKLTPLRFESLEKKRKVVEVPKEASKEEGEIEKVKKKKEPFFKRLFRKRPAKEKFKYKPPKKEEIKEGELSVHTWYK